MMKQIISIICGIMVCLSLSAQTLEPIKANIGKLSLSIDPRMELLGVIQIIADYPLVTKDTPYRNEIEEYFAPMKDSKAVLLTKELFTAGFSYDAPAAFMLYLSQPSKIKDVLPYSPYLIERAGGKEKLDAYRDAIVKFVKESKFVDFWRSKEDFYKRSITLISEELTGMDLVRTIEDYYKSSKSSYNIVICPLFCPYNYGTEIETKKGNNDIYSFTSTYDNKDDIPFIDKENIEGMVLHEFSHSFVNPLTGKYMEQALLSEKLFEPIKDIMSKRAYPRWEIVLNEHIIRAFTMRMVEISQGEQAFHDRINNEYQQGFVYIEPIIEMLKDYEKERDVNGVTFAQYFPTLLSAMEKLDPKTIVFRGPINNALHVDKLTFIYPTAGTDTEIMDKTKQYVVLVADFIKQKLNKECDVISDSVALNSRLDDCGILCYGTMQSNLFLSHYRDIFPFQIKDGVLMADKEYNNSELRFMSCVPNPQNDQYGMTIYTALKDENVININNFRHGICDYHIFSGDKRVLSEGHYNKSNHSWKFNK